MKKIRIESLKTGAKKALATTSLVIALAAALVPTAHAEVIADNIVGDYEVTEDRSEIKSNEAISIMDKFYGVDTEGNAYVVTQDIKNAIELSDILNGYFFDPVAYTNTTASEITSLNIESLYADYKVAKESNVEENVLNFCATNLPLKPAIDAFITFGSGNVAADLKACLANRICDALLSNGSNITFGPVIIANDCEFYCLAEVNGNLRKIYLQGESCDNLRNIIFYLENTYNLAINNVAGYSEEHDLSFMYNGIDLISNSSAYLSLPDDDKKDLVKNGINLITEITSTENYSITTAETQEKIALSESDKELLEAYGIKGKTTAFIEYVNLTKVEQVAKTLN